ncbi:O-phosphoserine--tRNA ligase [Methanopyrus sp.]
MPFDREKLEELRSLARRDFDRAWREGAELVREPGLRDRYPRIEVETGESHPLFETIQRLREAYLRAGFREVVNPVIIPEEEVYKQFGPEAAAVLDRCFYLAGLPRPDVGLGADKVEKLAEVLGRKPSEEEVERLRETLHAYKKGEIDGDELTHEIAEALNTDDGTAVRVLDEVFPELKRLKPEPLEPPLTLRSHMTAGWFLTLSEILKREDPPLKLFSIDRCFRREQREDESHLMSYHSASCVVVGDDVTVDTGKAVAEAILRQFGFEDFEFVPDEKMSKYYVPGTQTEVYAYHPDLEDSIEDEELGPGWVEIATFGLYSPVALAEYGIEYPVMNLGIGVERLCMVLHGIEDVRSLAYVEYEPWEPSDLELARAIDYERKPATSFGERLVREVVRGLREHADEEGPVKVELFRGEFGGREVVVHAVEEEKGEPLAGPAAFNRVYVLDGSLYAVPPEGDFGREIREKGVDSGISFDEGLAARLAYEVEELLATGGGETTVKVRKVSRPSQVNIRLSRRLLRYVTEKGGEIEIRGPVFVTLRAEVR